MNVREEIPRELIFSPMQFIVDLLRLVSGISLMCSDLVLNQSVCLLLGGWIVFHFQYHSDLIWNGRSVLGHCSAMMAVCLNTREKLASTSALTPAHSRAYWTTSTPPRLG